MPDRRRLVPSGAARPTTRIVHLGLGAFFRAHVASYLQDLGGWGVIAVSLRSPDVREKLKPQDCVYTAAELAEGTIKTRLIEVVRDVLVAPKDQQAVIDAMCDPTISLVSLTVTEKGYCHDPATGELNWDNPDIVHDLTHDLPRSAPGFIVHALQSRRAAGVPPFTVLSCDNLSDNGALIRRVTLAFAEQVDPALANWISETCAFPATMVDRIVPATTDVDVATVTGLIGSHDAAPVMHEPFRQWVIADCFHNETFPPLDQVGVQFVSDVAPFEDMKLRMLNGTHSALAYLGYLVGHRTVAEAVTDPLFADFVRHLWTHEIGPTVAAPEGTDLSAYAETLMSRFANRGVAHSLGQIAMDGSQKLPQRFLAPIKERLRENQRCDGLILCVAAWMVYVSGQAGKIDVRDPLAERLSLASADPEKSVDNILALREIFEPALAEKLKVPLNQYYADLQQHGVRDCIRKVLS
ncbi:fructuronate reductase [Cognatiyoonia koreensis]|uniref:Fructuronate reductase n=1 Tax=Cognatiyoonia koreensis TaxID=364200 RepID=A0A1I0RTT6_9RHOB|nr:mannitol dehydrogenase family protein [Cognatiyoonia koreensis]SEW44839.1 fructuronate reductase [Cognatiyoonia koreensis]